LIAGSAAFGSIPFIGKLFASKAQAQETVLEVTYKGSTYTIVVYTYKYFSVKGELGAPLWG
jgi:hypothetical protein